METSQNLALNDRELNILAQRLYFVDNKSKQEIIDVLVLKGMNEQDAGILFAEVAKELNGQKKSGANRDVIVGSLWFFGGILVTAITYMNAQGGGTYFVTYGAIIFGGIQLFRGLANQR